MTKVVIYWNSSNIEMFNTRYKPEFNEFYLIIGNARYDLHTIKQVFINGERKY